MKGAIDPVLGTLRTLRSHGERLRRARLMSGLYRQARPPVPRSGRVLFWVPGGMPLMLHVEGALAAALRLRGVDVHAVLCDGPYRACVRREVRDGAPVHRWQRACASCRAQTGAVLDGLGIPYSFVGQFVPESARAPLWEATASITWENLDDLSFHGVRVGKNARSAVLRYLRGADLAGHEAIVREYAFSALMCAAAARSALERLFPSRVFMSHGIYVDWGPALHTALSLGVPVAAWMASYLASRFYFRHVEDGLRIDFHDMSPRAWEECRRTILSSAQEARLDGFLGDRYRRRVSFDMKLLSGYTGEGRRLRERYAPDPGKPVWGIMAHINWDCVSDYSPMAYPTFDDWMLDTIREAVEIRDVQWLVKVHPAEAWDNPASGVQRLIDRHFPSLPPHVRVIPATEEMSPLDFFELVDGGITVYGTAGLEMALLGKPVILAGEAHYGGKGFSHDGVTPDLHRGLLRRAASLPGLSEEQRRLARRYAYCYFIQRQVPFPAVKDPGSAWWRLQNDRLPLLLPGADPFVDFLCDRLLDGRDFIMDEGLVDLAERRASDRPEGKLQLTRARARVS